MIEPVKGTNTHRVFKEDPSKYPDVPIDSGGVVPEKSFSAITSSASANSTKVDDGSVVDVFFYYTYSMLYPANTSSQS